MMLSIARMVKTAPVSMSCLVSCSALLAAFVLFPATRCGDERSAPPRLRW